MAPKIEKSDAEWRKQLSPEEYNICRLKGTEAPFSGKYCDTKEPGVYKCACCGNKLFTSDTKFDSGSGWPSFYDVLDKGSVKLNEDRSHGMHRVEVTCAACDAHLGHLFPDGPRPTGQRFCINSASLDLDRKPIPGKS